MDEKIFMDSFENGYICDIFTYPFIVRLFLNECSFCKEKV